MAAPGFRQDIWNELRTTLPAQLPGYLVRQRWFGGKARKFQSTEVTDVVSLRRDQFEALVLFVRVEYVSSGADHYAIPVVGHTVVSDEETVPVLRVPGENGREMILRDAFTNEEFRSLLLDAIQKGSIFRGEHGEIRTSCTKALSAYNAAALSALRPKSIKAEQSNSSIAYGERAILKFFRRLEEGINPDLEIGTFLTEIAHYQHTPQLLGALEYRHRDGWKATQGILQTYVPNQGDAWQYTLETISHFYKEAAEQSGDTSKVATAEDVPEPARSSVNAYLASAGLLAQRTAELHIALASDSRDPVFAPEPFDDSFRHRFEQSVLDLTKDVFGLLRQRITQLPDGVREKGKQIAGRENEIAERFHFALSKPIRATRIRIHADYHLGQVLYTGKDFVIIDFEGEPARPLSERRMKRSPLQDVAGMLRSFHYAAYAPLLAQVGTAQVDTSKIATLSVWAEAWNRWVAERFLSEYLKKSQTATFLPSNSEELRILLQVHLLEKAVYELGYELNNRPSWVGIPLAGITKALEI
ncbi:MAG TPA: putative maltokinase [Candidatus Dormibacteraeota bacterium]|nr:putative maltokinase [Candidatus Dormibacteraeota bacterium]